MLKSGITIVSLSWLASAHADTCSYDVWGDYQTFSCPRLFDSYDEYYCCGSGSSQYCCDHDEYFGVSYVNIPGIIGGVISFLVFVGVIIAFSICCCVASCPFYRRRHQGRVVAGGRGAVVISQTQQMNRMAGPAPGMARPLHPQYGVQGGGYTGYYNQSPHYSVPGVVQPPPQPPPQPQAAYPPPAPPPNYQQATQTQSVTVTTAGGANPVYPPM